MSALWSEFCTVPVQVLVGLSALQNSGVSAFQGIMYGCQWERNPYLNNCPLKIMMCPHFRGSE